MSSVSSPQETKALSPWPTSMYETKMPASGREAERSTLSSPLPPQLTSPSREAAHMTSSAAAKTSVPTTLPRRFPLLRLAIFFLLSSTCVDAYGRMPSMPKQKQKQNQKQIQKQNQNQIQKQTQQQQRRRGPGRWKTLWKSPKMMIILWKTVELCSKNSCPVCRQEFTCRGGGGLRRRPRGRGARLSRRSSRGACSPWR